MKGPEARFYDQLVRRFPDWDFQRIETLTSNGVPDVHICIPFELEFWCELKAPMTTKGQTCLRMEQYAWGMRRSAAGGKVWVLSRYKETVAGWVYPFGAEPASKGHVSIKAQPTFTKNIKELRDIKHNLITPFK